LGLGWQRLGNRRLAPHEAHSSGVAWRGSTPRSARAIYGRLADETSSLACRVAARLGCRAPVAVVGAAGGVRYGRPAAGRHEQEVAAGQSARPAWGSTAPTTPTLENISESRFRGALTSPSPGQSPRPLRREEPTHVVLARTLPDPLLERLRTTARRLLHELPLDLSLLGVDRRTEPERPAAVLQTWNEAPTVRVRRVALAVPVEVLLPLPCGASRGAHGNVLDRRDFLPCHLYLSHKPNALVPPRHLGRGEALSRGAGPILRVAAHNTRKRKRSPTRKPAGPQAFRRIASRAPLSRLRKMTQRMRAAFYDALHDDDDHDDEEDDRDDD
jgi:hypothetical protein